MRGPWGRRGQQQPVDAGVVRVAAVTCAGLCRLVALCLWRMRKRSLPCVCVVLHRRGFTAARRLRWCGHGSQGACHQSVTGAGVLRYAWLSMCTVPLDLLTVPTCCVLCVYQPCIMGVCRLLSGPGCHSSWGFGDQIVGQLCFVSSVVSATCTCRLHARVGQRCCWCSNCRCSKPHAVCTDAATCM